MDPLDTSLLDESAPRGARIVALALLADLAAERERLGTKHDQEALHDFRVALRRLRSWLRALRRTLRGSLPSGALRRLRRMAKASNAGRDAEVFRDWLRAAAEHLPARKRSAAHWLMARFERQEREADASLDLLLERDFARAHEKLQQRLEVYQLEGHVHAGMTEPTMALALAALLREQAAELRDRLLQVHTQDDDISAHRARIAGKRLRYLLEPVAPHIERGEALVERLKGLQDSLGDLHDAHVWILMLREMAAEAATEEGRRLGRPQANGERGRTRAAPYPALTDFAQLVRLAQQRAGEAFEQFAPEWGKRGGRRFFKDLDAACTALEARARQGVEIERKFLLTRLPKGMPGATTSHIAQGYLPGRRLVERLRSERRGPRTRYFRTVKSGVGIVRSELEEETTRQVFDAMWPLTAGKRLTKLRHRIPDGDLTWEVDEFPDQGLVLAELELPTATRAVDFPEWLAPYVDREVTGDAAYLNVNLAR